MAENVAGGELNGRIQERRWPNILNPQHCIIYLLIAALAVLGNNYSMAIQEVDSLKVNYQKLLDDKLIGAEVGEETCKFEVECFTETIQEATNSLARCEKLLEEEQTKATETRENNMNKERYACKTDLAECTQKSLEDRIERLKEAAADCRKAKYKIEQTAIKYINKCDDCTKYGITPLCFLFILMCEILLIGCCC